MIGVEDHRIAGAQPAPAFHIRSVATKLAMGSYSTEDVPCFCGSNNYAQLSERDRYGIPHRMCFCKDCGVIYANPRMTPESYRKFYKDDYRLIYEDDEDSNYNLAKTGRLLYDFLNSMGITPKSVLEIGCNNGEMLKAFAPAATVSGVDLDPQRVSDGVASGIPIINGTIYDAPKIEHDLVIMHHVIEHLTDLKDTLTEVSKRLSRGGYLYVGTPGLYNPAFRESWCQNAHTYQFVPGTLRYVMQSCGYEEIYCDDAIIGVYQYAGDLPVSVEPEQVRALGNFLQYGKHTKLPPITANNKFSIKDRSNNLKYSLATSIPNIGILEGCEKGKSAVIIGGGPSVDSHIAEIAAMDGVVICIERMAGWCQEHDITPDYVVCVDASDDVFEAFKHIIPGARYLVASQCPPDVFDLLADADAHLFQTVQRGLDMAQIWADANREELTIVNAGGSVTLTCMSIAMLLGMRDLHVYGFDCHTTDGGYAKGITGVGVQKDTAVVSVDDRVFKSTPAYLSFMQQFFHLEALGKRVDKLDHIEVHGDSLINAVRR